MKKMPLMFVGHGNPMHAISENDYTKGWEDSIRECPIPNAILCISAHWETKGTHITAMQTPRTIHDFYGFPEALSRFQYPCAGSPLYAESIQEKLKPKEIYLNHEWGLDHGAWSVLCKMYPDANIPVFQMSLDTRLSPQAHYELAKELKFLREKGVLIIGSGNIVHNLRMAKFETDATPYPWAIEFDLFVKEAILKGDHQALIQYEKLGTKAMLSIPTPEHYLPLLYILALQEKSEELKFFNEGIDFGSGSMRSLKIAS